MKYFQPYEFHCPCCAKGYMEMDKNLLDKVDHLREVIGQVLHVNSGFRCAKHNLAIGGAPQSKHMQGKAVDISTANMSSAKKHEFIKLVLDNFEGVGIAKTFIHMDVRSEPAVWFY